MITITKLTEVTMSDTQNHRMEALEWWRQLTRLEQLEIVGKYSNGKDFEFIATSSSQIQKLYIEVKYG